MNVIINGFHDRVIYPILPLLFKEYDIDYCEAIVNRPFETTLDVGEIRSHMYNDLSFAEYAVNWNEILPLDESVITNLRDTEAVVLKMFDRLEPYLGKLPYSLRKSLYLQHLRYWNHLMETKNIDLFLSANIPHEIYDYVIYGLCKLKGIPILMFHQSIPDFVFLLEDWESFLPEIRASYKEISASKGDTHIELSGRALKLWNSQTVDRDDPVPVYMKKKPFYNRMSKKARRVAVFFVKPFQKGFRKSIRKGHKWRTLIFLVFELPIQRIKGWRYKKYYQKHAIKPDLNKKFIYFPLHLQPELTTSPIAGAYVDQLLMIETISYYLPENYWIYIKENPKQKNFGRNLGFYRRLKALNNVWLVPIKYNSFRLIENCIAVATASGTSGWEALFREKPVIMFGHFFYQYAPGVFQVHHKKDCEQAIESIINQGRKPNMEEVKWYLVALDQNSIHANYHSIYFAASELSEKDNLENLYLGMKKKLAAMGIVAPN